MIITSRIIHTEKQRNIIWKIHTPTNSGHFTSYSYRLLYDRMGQNKIKIILELFLSVFIGVAFEIYFFSKYQFLQKRLALNGLCYDINVIARIK